MANEEYIERNSLLKEVKQIEGVFAAPLIIRKIENAPVEDVVAVIRCCKCIHFKTNISKENYCDIHSTTWDKFYVRHGDFCSYGERR